MPQDLIDFGKTRIKAKAFINSDVANITAVATADGSDPATTQALANALKVKLNALIAALKV